jgi:hypothetical protein
VQHSFDLVENDEPGAIIEPPGPRIAFFQADRLAFVFDTS